MLQCATSESVVRLHKTKLKYEVDEIQRIYFRDQHHESLLDFLSHEWQENSSLPQLLQVMYYII